MAELPFVTVILPVRNEGRFLAGCLEAVVAQDYPHDNMEILVVDGMSTDNTRAIAADFAVRDPRVCLLDNQERIVPTALNQGIRFGRGDVVIRVDGHTIIAQDYVRRCVMGLDEQQADNVGGPMRAIGKTWLAQAIALATSSRFGVGNARFHYAQTCSWVDTVYMGAFPCRTFDRIGLFDEELVRNQDDEFNLRLTRSGGKIWLDPAIRSTYFVRSSLRSLWKQYFEYGFWKVRVIQKHGRPAAWRHLIPVLFVLALAITLVASLAVGSPLPFFAVALTYLAAASAAALVTAIKQDWRYTFILPIAFATLHLAYGVGFVFGLVRFGLTRPSLRSVKQD